MARSRARLVVFAVLLLVGLGLIGLDAAGALGPVRNILLAPLSIMQRGVSRAWGGVSGLFQSTPSETALAQRNVQLEAQVASLQAQVTQLQENQADFKVLSDLLKFARARPENQYLAAAVIGRDPSPYLSYVILDRGSDQGIRKDMPVVAAGGLVGRVVEVTSVACKVLPVVDAASSVNARLLTSREEGVVVGQPAGGLQMQYLSQSVNVNVGETVVTSGLGGHFPADLLIGTVNAVQKQDYEVLQKADLTPAADFSRLDIVLIITNFKPIDFSPFLQATPGP
jgi:rod shape-determining protein MreC